MFSVRADPSGEPRFCCSNDSESWGLRTTVLYFCMYYVFTRGGQGAGSIPLLLLTLGPRLTEQPLFGILPVTSSVGDTQQSTHWLLRFPPGSNTGRFCSPFIGQSKLLLGAEILPKAQSAILPAPKKREPEYLCSLNDYYKESSSFVSLK